MSRTLHSREGLPGYCRGCSAESDVTSLGAVLLRTLLRESHGEFSLRGKSLFQWQRRGMARVPSSQCSSVRASGHPPLIPRGSARLARLLRSGCGSPRVRRARGFLGLNSSYQIGNGSWTGLVVCRRCGILEVLALVVEFLLGERAADDLPSSPTSGRSADPGSTRKVSNSKPIEPVPNAMSSRPVLRMSSVARSPPQAHRLIERSEQDKGSQADPRGALSDRG